MIAITNGKVVTVTDKTYEKGTVLIEDGKIKAVGEKIEIPHDAQVIDAAGCWVMPGLIDCHTHISNFNHPAGRQRDEQPGHPAGARRRRHQPARLRHQQGARSGLFHRLRAARLGQRGRRHRHRHQASRCTHCRGDDPARHRADEVCDGRKSKALLRHRQ